MDLNHNHLLQFQKILLIFLLLTSQTFSRPVQIERVQRDDSIAGQTNYRIEGKKGLQIS